MYLNKDEYGLLGQIQPGGTIEGGDCLNWQAQIQYLDGDTLWEHKHFIKKFMISFGAFVRHFDPSRTTGGFGAYYKGPWHGCISRDQLTGALCLIIKNRDWISMTKVFIHASAWLWLFSYNTVHNGVNFNPKKWKLPDLTIMDIWSLYLRGFHLASWVLWPIYLIFDIWGVLQSIHYNLVNSGDPISFAIKQIAKREHFCTPFSWIAWEIINKDKLKREIRAYWCGWRKNCDMYPYYERKINSLS